LSSSFYNLPLAKFYTGSISSVPYGTLPIISLIKDASNNNIFNFSLTTGPQGPKGDTPNLQNFYHH
jgi:hypothetical protein